MLLRADANAASAEAESSDVSLSSVQERRSCCSSCSSSHLSVFQSFLASVSGSWRSTLRPTWALLRCWRVTQTAFLTPSSAGLSRSLSAVTGVFAVELPAGSEVLTLEHPSGLL